MRGQLEVYRVIEGERTLVAEGGNIVVDGASESIVDLLTTPPGLAFIPALSSLLDTSNYTVQAISFGTEPVGASSNAHQEFRELTNGDTAESWIINLATSDASVVVYTGPTGDLEYLQENALPNTPSPLDTSLNRIKGDGVQHENILEFSGFYRDSSMSAVLERGAFGPSTGTIKLTASDVGGSNLFNHPMISAYNVRGTMDAKGYVKLVSGSTDPSGALIVSSTSDFSSTGEVIYQTQFDPDDIGSLELYGGLYSMGLWTIDVNESLLTGVSFPFTFNKEIDRRIHKLFSKKIFTKSLTNHNIAIPPSSTASSDKLLIIWRIFF